MNSANRLTLSLLDAIMRIAIAPLKLDFASWLRTNACKKGLSLILLLIKFKLLQLLFRAFENVWIFVNNMVFKIEKLLN